MTRLRVALEGGALVEAIHHPDLYDGANQGTMMAPTALPASFLSPLGCQRIAVRSAAVRHRVVAQVPLAAAAPAAPEEAARPQARSVQIGRAAPSCVPMQSGAPNGRSPAGKAKGLQDRQSWQLSADHWCTIQPFG